MSVDLEELGKRVDEVLENETSESLTKWLNERRQKADARTDAASVKETYNNMTTKEIEILDRVNGIKSLKTIDSKVNYVYNGYNFGLSKMTKVRDYFIRNM